MFSTLRNAWKVPDIRKKMLYTIMMLIVYRIGAHVPVPGVDVAFVAQEVGKSPLGGFVNLFAGGGLSNFSLFALGIIPYVTASIIMNLLTMALPPLERMSKEGPEGRKKIASITRYAGVGLGLIQAIGMITMFGKDAILNTGTPMILNYITIVLCLTAGTALIMWIGEHITENGVGNGISLIIFVGIVSALPSAAVTYVGNVVIGAASVVTLIIVILASLAIVAGITFIDMGERRIPVQYAKRVVGRKIYGGQSTHIPMKINSSGVMPLIFAMTLVQFPTIIIGILPNGAESLAGYNAVMGPTTPLYLVLFALLIFFFTFFYAQATFNPMDVSKNLQQNGGFIPGIRAGKPTSDYLQKILVRVTLFGAIFLALVATVPTMIAAFSGFNSPFGATGLLIMVSVSLETTRQLESHMMMRHYKGFLK